MLERSKVSITRLYSPKNCSLRNKPSTDRLRNACVSCLQRCFGKHNVAVRVFLEKPAQAECGAKNSRHFLERFFEYPQSMSSMDVTCMYMIKRSEIIISSRMVKNLAAHGGGLEPNLAALHLRFLLVLTAVFAVMDVSA